MSRGALVAFAIVLVTGVAAADDAANKKRAQELASESATHYKRGEFEISAALLRQAYALYPEPNLLYNLGRSLESVGDTKGAIDAYDQYLKSGRNIEDRGAIERRIATLKQELADKEKRDKPPENAKPPDEPKKDEVKPEPAIVKPLPQPAQPADESPSPLPWVPVGIGVAAIGAGVYLGHTASSKHDQAVSAMVGTDAQKLQDDAHNFATYANIAFAVGGVAAAIGIVWEIHERTSSHRTSGVGMRARLSPTGVALEWSLP